MNAPLDATAASSWAELNRDWLLAGIARLAARLGDDPAPGPHRPPEAFTPALLHVARAFGLSGFEHDLLLILAGLELDDGLRRTVGGSVSFGLALGALEEPHWDALSPSAPLRRWDMVRLDEGEPLAQAPLRIDERLLHFVTGVAAADPEIEAVATPIGPGAADHPLAGHLARMLAEDPPRAVALVGDADERRDLALAALARLGSAAVWLTEADLPGDAPSLGRLARRLDRELRLTGAVPVLAAGEAEEGPAATLAARLLGPFLWLGCPPPASGQPLRRIDVPPPDPRRTRERLATRCGRLSPDADEATGAALDRVARQFRLGSAGLDDVADALRAATPEERPAVAWQAAREAARGGLDALAGRIDTRVGFDDLVLPTGQTAILRDIARHLRHRETVWRDWGLGAKHDLGRGLVALFAGESGTGKTLAAEAIAGEVGLDLYRVDLAALVSKWIGETEKNLRRLFDAAEASGAVLLFDEADALFGRRSEVRDSHDRYANLEVAYLLQRLEAYRGLAILTTNMRSSLDRAFLRRIRFVVTFPFPDAAARERIWRRQFPPEAPLGEVDWAALARLHLSGGHIRATAVGAAFKAADRGGAIDQALLMEAAREEFAKMEKPAHGRLAGEARLP